MPTAHEALAVEASPSESRTEGPAAPAPMDDASVRLSVARRSRLALLWAASVTAQLHNLGGQPEFPSDPHMLPSSWQTVVEKKSVSSTKARVLLEV